MKVGKKWGNRKRWGDGGYMPCHAFTNRAHSITMTKYRRVPSSLETVNPWLGWKEFYLLHTTTRVIIFLLFGLKESTILINFSIPIINSFSYTYLLRNWMLHDVWKNVQETFQTISTVYKLLHALKFRST